MQNEAIRPENKELAKLIIGQIKAGVDEWQMPWHKGIVEAVNALTGRVYTGYNATILWQQAISRGYSSNQWATLKQWRKFKGMVRRGARGVALFQPLKRAQRNSDGTIENFIYAYKRYHVFNYDDVNNVNFDHPDMFSAPHIKTFVFNETAELIAKRSEAIIKHGGTNAFYSPSTDHIGMPSIQSFFTTKIASASENYYSTLLHELIHWTKKSNRAQRGSFFVDTRKDYAFEELVAELGASILTTRIDGLVCPREDHAAYLQYWLSILEDDFEYFYKALLLAQKAADWLCTKAQLGVNRYGWHLDDDDDDDKIVAAIDTFLPEDTVLRPFSLLPPSPFASASKFHHNWTVGNFNWLVRSRIHCAGCAHVYSVVLELDANWSSCPRCYVYNCFESVNDMFNLNE